MAELVKHGGRVVPRDQHGFARFAFHEVRVVGYDRHDLGPELFLRAVLVHPGTGALACARVGIEVPPPDALTVALDLVDAHVGMINRHIVDLDEAQVIERIRHPEHRLAHLFELQILADLGLIEIVFFLAHFLRVIAVVPRFDLDPGTLAVGDRLHVGDFFACAHDRRLPYLHHQGHGLLRCSGHVVVENPVRVTGETEELGAFGAQLQDLGNHRFVVVRARVIAAHRPHAPALFAQVAPRGVGNERLHRRPRIGEEPLALLALRCRSGRRRVAKVVRQSREIGFMVDDERVALFVGQLVLAEDREEAGKALVDLLQAEFFGFAKRRTATDEVRVDDVGESLLLGQQVRSRTRLVNRFQAREQRVVLNNFVVEGGQHRRELGLGCLHALVVHGRRVDSKDSRCAPERPPGIVERGKRVLEVWRSAVARDRGDLESLQLHASLDGGFEGGDFHHVETRKAAVRSRPLVEERVTLLLRGSG